MQAGPIIGEENRIAGIGGVVFYAGGLAGGDASQVGHFFEAGDVLGGFVGDAGNRIGVVEKLLRAVRRGEAGVRFGNLPDVLRRGR